MCKFVAVNRVGKPCALVAHARFEMGAVDLEFLRSAAYLIEGTACRYHLPEEFLRFGRRKKLPDRTARSAVKKENDPHSEF